MVDAGWHDALLMMKWYLAAACSILLLSRRHPSCMLASPVLDAGKQCMTLCEILLNFLAPVENGTVTGCAQNILMEATLAPLALGPEGTEGEFKVIDCAECFLVHSAFLQPETICDAEGGHPPAQYMPLPAHSAITASAIKHLGWLMCS